MHGNSHPSDLFCLTKFVTIFYLDQSCGEAPAGIFVRGLMAALSCPDEISHFQSPFGRVVEYKRAILNRFIQKRAPFYSVGLTSMKCFKDCSLDDINK